MIILGIDPGIAIVGYGVIEYKNFKFKAVSFGAVTTPKDMPTEKRLEVIYEDLGTIIKKYKPDAVAIEELFFNNNQKTAIKVAEARGVILLACRHARLPVFEYTPLQVKSALVGYGRAEKKQVISMVKMFLNLGDELKLDDTADALAIAICHGHTGASMLSPYYNLK